MADIIYGSIWKLISEHKFPTDSNLTCILCKQLMIDACQSHCGCQYCYTCIKEFIGTDLKYCPGNKDYCYESFLAVDINVFRNAHLNRLISTLKVECPNQSCGLRFQLIDMNEHVRLCTKLPIKCPFVPIGCSTDQSNKDSVVTHLHNDTLTHSELLIGLIQNMRNEINLLKDDIQIGKSESLTLKNELVDVRNQIESSVNTATAEIKMQMNAQQLEITDLRIIIDGLVRGVKEESVKNSIEATTFMEDSRDKDNRIEILEKVVREMKNKTDNLKLQIENLKIKGEEFRNDINTIEVNRKTYDINRERKMIYWIKWNKLCPDVGVDFVWYIDKYSKRMNNDMFSESFYSNNYKLCLSMRMYNYGSIGLWCVIMKGEHDDKLVWPMRGTVILSIIDRDTLEINMKDSFHYDFYGRDKSAFDRPKSDKNSSWIGKDSFIRISSLECRKSFSDDDPIIVSCSLGGI